MKLAESEKRKTCAYYLPEAHGNQALKAIAAIRQGNCCPGLYSNNGSDRLTSLLSFIPQFPLTICLVYWVAQLAAVVAAHHTETVGWRRIA